ncbi:Surp And G-Patch Domain-Containing Protein 2 [Manis pentadactyla]|nr:Surp And G-Patch Domain-Containing Protein 2 [Manis pentadactyla]
MPAPLHMCWIQSPACVEGVLNAHDVRRRQRPWPCEDEKRAQDLLGGHQQADSELLCADGMVPWILAYGSQRLRCLTMDSLTCRVCRLSSKGS